MFSKNSIEFAAGAGQLFFLHSILINFIHSFEYYHQKMNKYRILSMRVKKLRTVFFLLNSKFFLFSIQNKTKNLVSKKTNSSEMWEICQTNSWIFQYQVEIFEALFIFVECKLTLWNNNNNNRKLIYCTKYCDRQFVRKHKNYGIKVVKIQFISNLFSKYLFILAT